ncbi:hypothetical protein M9H77_23953 [Catharanthus roseus]|uniref:Uncharacterized protein n=1 Tax=Catharanthus roseus TaxID=4058 RepID=A0ACC0AUS1_CATRO|nr:hypothetical protein M9H77_23953 [Catharanthus roseus]
MFIKEKGQEKVSVESVDVVGIDRISNLPDSILCFILLFLPTLYSVRTSLLSKRWKLLWTQVPTIRINARHKDEISFTTPNDKGKLIEKFKLSLWINDAIAKNIKHLDLQTSFTESIEVPENLFICKTLESLKLYDLQVMIRGGVQLSRLHTLVLYFVTFGDEECFHKIVNGCPKLENFLTRLSKLAIKVICCQWNNILFLLESSVNLEVLILQKVRISSWEKFHHQNWTNPARVPLCMLSSLREISIINCQDCEDDLQLIKYFLQHGEVLERLTSMLQIILIPRPTLKWLKRYLCFADFPQHVRFIFLRETVDHARSS